MGWITHIRELTAKIYIDNSFYKWAKNTSVEIQYQSPVGKSYYICVNRDNEIMGEREESQLCKNIHYRTEDIL